MLGICYEPHDNTITGHPGVIENAKLRGLVAKRHKTNIQGTKQVQFETHGNNVFKSIDLYTRLCPKGKQVELKISL